MTVRQIIDENDGIFFVTITCYRWLELFEVTNGYDIVYKWFDYLKKEGHYVNGYVIMPNHLHVLLAFQRTVKVINHIIGNGKRFIAYEIVKRRLKQDNHQDLLNLLRSGVNKTDKNRGKLHQVFQPSFDWKECWNDHFIDQKLNYIHQNPIEGKWTLVDDIADYLHSSARYYITGQQGAYPVTNIADLKDIDLTKPHT